ncbi:major facilitator superfamily domain-containing protein [Xylaria longipes]|nr:major facilitator superfamily domain-containing protein [Xylaria longipes]
MEGSPIIPAGTNDPNEDPVKDHDLSNAKTLRSNVGGDETNRRGQINEQNYDDGIDRNDAHNSDGTTTLNDIQAPLESSFVTAPELPETDGARDAEKESVVEEDIKRELTEDDCESELGYAFSTRKKWWILCVIFLVQTSMNFNTSLYSNGVVGIMQEFHVTDHVARAGAAIFLITYAFGCELWAPWSEEFGRKLILQLSLLLTNVWTIPVGLAPNITTILISRGLGGLSTAGGSVTLGMVADMYDSDNQQYAVAFVVFSSVIGSILGPIVGGFVELLPPDQAWRWCAWIQLIFGVAVQLLHLLTVPETRTTILMDRIARKRREAKQDPNVYGPGEMQPFKKRFTFAELMETWSRAFKMLMTEPIVRILSMLSGASDAIVFMQIQSMNLVYKQWDFNSWQIGLAFVPIAIGYFIAWMIFIPIFKHGQRRREEKPHDEHAQFESRLYPMLFLSICLPLGLAVFGAGSMGPRLHWSVSMIGTGLIGIANYSIYMATIDYMVCAYGPYSASATGGNGLARDFLAGALTPAAIPFYTSMAPDRSTSLMWGSFMLCIISTFLVAISWSVYRKGALYRKKSPFAQNIRLGNEVTVFTPRPYSPDQPSPAESVQDPALSFLQEWFPGLQNRRPRSPPRQPSFGPTSPRGAYMASVHAASRRQSRQNSRNPSANPSRRNSQEGRDAAVPLALSGMLNFQEQPRIEEQPGEEQSLSFSDVATIHPGAYWRRYLRGSGSEDSVIRRCIRNWGDSDENREPRHFGEQSGYEPTPSEHPSEHSSEHPEHPDEYPYASHNEVRVEPPSQRDS